MMVGMFEKAVQRLNLMWRGRRTERLQGVGQGGDGLRLWVFVSLGSTGG
jgi:hypothetical protein